MSKALAAAKAIYGEQFEPRATLRGLTYFADGELPNLPASTLNALSCTRQRTMNYSEELLAVAKRVFWFGTPEEALEFPTRFLTYAMTYASDEDIEIVRKYFSDEDFKTALDNPAPGIFDRVAWAKWNMRYGRIPVPPLPKRQIPGVDPAIVADLFPQKS